MKKEKLIKLGSIVQYSVEWLRDFQYVLPKNVLANDHRAGMVIRTRADIGLDNAVYQVLVGSSLVWIHRNHLSILPAVSRASL